MQKLNVVQNPANSPLFAASAYGLLSVLSYMHSQISAHEGQIDYDMKNSNGVSAVYLSARYGKAEVLKFLLVRGAALNPLRGYYGSPLQAAAFHDHDEALNVLIEHEADPFTPGKFKNIVDAGVAGGHEKIIHVLL